ncbi:type IV secretion/conjugal transfer ATPase, VirB4 family [Anaeromyxobacter dehalogenans 2CP-1]|uniref:Type IV secretion/conjugal transfer ATPase, VirB4 family n=1 Tax=Anaeromyxobacter dehalogenans (strain ATCC BAA-258 / DSM 21875 / 2CP-1) TaxID=455488 RepID=B8JFP4_ANAD2|nr:VirB4 family type IV secretion/conjugal transfer ATPase [Anaeromyxobacter dehalogenans]ACL64482.1 type IV secretion/conjugal transfer ATPase, VirB4 family [Anaeromyxobacter dehalogenans 2CP-1]
MGRVNLLQASRGELPATAFVPYSHHVTPTIVATRGGEYLSAWKLGGRAHEAASAGEQAEWVADLNNAWRGLAEAGVAFWSHVVRRRADAFPRSAFDGHFCRRLDAAYAATLAGARFMVNELYLTPVVRTVGDEVLEALGRREKEDVPAKLRRQQDGIAKLDDLNRALGSTLRRYGAELLRTYEGEGGKLFSAPLEALGQLVNGERLPMPVCRDRFGDYLVVNRPLFGWHGEVGELRLVDRVRRFGMLEIVEYDGKGTTPGDLDGLLRAEFEFILTQSFAALSKHAAKGFLERHKQRLLDAKDVARSQVAEIDFALDQLMSGSFVVGEHHATLLAFGESADEVRDHLAWARSELLDRGIVAKPVDLALEAGFWAQLPGNLRWRPRPMAITSQNFLCFSPFHNFMTGKAAGNPWGPAVTVLRTASGTPLYFNFHASPAGEDSEGERLLGNTLILGQSSAGKTVLLGFLLAQAQKYRPTVVAFDKDRGLEIAIRAMGGCYLPLKSGEPTGWNPVQLEPTSANLLFLKGLVRALVSANGSEVTHEDEVWIDRSVDTVMTLIDRRHRRLSLLLECLPDPLNEDGAHPSVAARLRRWCEGGPYGWVFDNAEDVLDLGTNRVYGFDITELLDCADARGPMMKYLLHRTEAMLDGRRFIYVFDEWWRALSGEDFAELTKNKGKTIRKQDGFLVLCTQEPDDALQSPVGKSVIQQCATLLLLRNPNATREDYVEGLKLSEPEYELVRSLPEQSRRFLVKQGGGSAVAELDLSAMPEALAVLSGTPDRARLVEALAAECGEAPEQWLPRFWERLGVPVQPLEQETP